MINSKAQLTADISSSTFTTPQKGLLINIVDSYHDYCNRITTSQRNAISLPATGLMIFNTDTAQYEYYNGTNWQGMGETVGSPQTVKVFVSSAELQNITTAKDLIAAAGVGFATVPIKVYMKMDYESEAYDFENNELQIIHDTIDVATDSALMYVNHTLVNTASDVFAEAAITKTSSSKINVLENKKMVLKGKSNPSTGDSAITLYITYVTIEV